MSITRKFLKGMNLTDEQQEAIMDAHLETVNGLKADLDRYKGDAEKLPGVQKELDALKGDGGGWKEKHAALKKEYDDYKASVTAKETRGNKEKAVRALMKEIGIGEKHLDSILRIYDLDGVELDDKGAIKDADKRKEGIKEQFGDFVVTETVSGAQTAKPPVNNGGNTLTKADIYKKDEKGRYVMSTSERQAALAEMMK